MPVGKGFLINDTYVIDELCFLGYFLRRPPEVIHVNNYDKKVTFLRLYTDLYEGDFSKEQF